MIPPPVCVARPAPGLAGRFQYSTFFLMPLGRVQKTVLGAPGETHIGKPSPKAAESCRIRRANMTMTKRMRRAIEKDPLSLIVDLMKQQGEAAGREAFFKLVAESNNPDRAEQAHQLVEWAAEIFRGERRVLDKHA